MELGLSVNKDVPKAAVHQGGLECWIIEDTDVGYLWEDAFEEPLEIRVAEFETGLVSFKYLISK